MFFQTNFTVVFLEYWKFYGCGNEPSIEFNHVDVRKQNTEIDQRKLFDVSCL